MDLPTFSLEQVYAAQFKAVDNKRIPLQGVCPEYLGREERGVTLILKERGGIYFPHALYRPAERTILSESLMSQIPLLCSARTLEEFMQAAESVAKERRPAA